MLCHSRFASLITLALFSFSVYGATAAAPAPAPAPKDPPPKQTASAPKPVVPPPPIEWPKPIAQRSSSTPEQGAVIQSRPAAPFVFPKFKPFIPKVLVAEPPRVRPPLFLTRKERRYRSATFPKALEVKVGGLSDSTLSLKTTYRETEIDATAVAHEHENDIQMIEINRKLHEQVESLYSKKFIGKSEFEESRTRLIKSQSKAEESKAKLVEYKCEVALLRLKIAQTQGITITLDQLAEAYFVLWQARAEKVKATKDQAAATQDYLVFVLDVNRKLALKGANTKEAIIKAERDAEEAAILFRLSDALLQKMEKFRDDASDDLKAAQKAVGQQQAGTPS